MTEFVPFEIALLAKNAEFDEPCFGRFFKKKFSLNTLGKPYRHNCNEVNNYYLSAPMYQQIYNWLENVKELKLRKIPYTSGIDKWTLWKWNKDRVLWEELKNLGHVSNDEALIETLNLIING